MVKNRLLYAAGMGMLLAAFQAGAIQIACGLEGIADWGRSLPFKDAMKMCRSYRVVPATSTWDYTHAHLGRSDDEGAIGTVALRPDGYPTQIPSNGNRVLTVCLVGIPAEMYPFGTFTLLFEGTGQIYLGWDAGGPAPAGFTEGFIAEGHGHYVASAGATTSFEFTIANGAAFFGRYGGSSTRSSGIVLHIMQSASADPVRNIRLVIPDAQGGTGNVSTYETQPFNPVFLEDHRPFTLLRFMDWGATNNSNVQTWSQRMTPQTCFAARTALGGCGVAYEYMIDLCNLLRRDMWVCLPHRSDANYHTQLARLIRDRLDVQRKVYVEYSNETWNGQFQQNWYCNAQADALSLSTGTYPSWTKSGVYQTYAAVRIFKRFEDEFGAGASSRLVKVLSGWHINTDLTNAMLWARNQSSVNPDGVTIDAYATAPYFYYGGDLTAQTPLDVIYNYLYSTALPTVAGHARNQKGICNSNGVALISYEAGQHLLGNADKQYEFNRDPRMYQLYRAYIDTLHNCGMSILNQFVAVSSWGVYGCWGAKEYAGQPMAQAHKYRALYDYLLADSQFDPNEPRYWEQVLVLPRRDVLPGMLPHCRGRGDWYHLNGRLLPAAAMPRPVALRRAPGVMAGTAGVLLDLP